jgi:uncharacterized membrane protein YjfL (UPF0719 family)
MMPDFSLMSTDIPSVAASLVATVVVLLVGKWIYALTRRKHLDIREELLERDNLAFAVALGGYYFGLVLAVGGSLFGPHGYWLEDGTATLKFGLLAVILLNISRVINERVVLRKFDPMKEIVGDRNVGTGVVEAASHVANGLVLLGALSGEEVSLVVAVVFWALAQVVLVVGALFYEWFNPIDVHAEIERDNVAVGVAFAGVFVALGNVARVGASGDFIAWDTDLRGFFIFIVAGLVLLPVMRVVTDRILLNSNSLTAEMTEQETPNVGVGVIEAVAYIAGSFLIGWIL